MAKKKKIIEEHYRLKSSFAILSRSFCNADEIKDYGVIESVFSAELKKIRDLEEKLKNYTASYFEKNRLDVIETVRKKVKEKNGRL